MKKVLLLALTCLTISMTSKAQEEKIDFPNPFQFEMIDTVELSKNEIFERIQKYVAIAFNSSKSVIELRDKDAGQIVGKGNIMVHIPYIMPFETLVRFTFTVDVKDNKYRLILNDFDHEPNYIAGVSKMKPGGDLANEKPITWGISKKWWRLIKTESYFESLKFMKEMKLAVHNKIIKNDF